MLNTALWGCAGNRCKALPVGAALTHIWYHTLVVGRNDQRARGRRERILRARASEVVGDNSFE
eukprot:12479608-Alexandrium_andersonii.AAC.1